MRTRLEAKCGWLLAGAVLLFPGCLATIRTRHHYVEITSSPAGALVRVGEEEISTPGRLRVKRARHPVNLTATLGDRHFADQLVPIDPIHNIGEFFAIVFDGLLLIPGIVDLALAITQQYPSAVHIEFPRAPTAPPSMLVQYEQPSIPQSRPGRFARPVTMAAE